MPLDSAEGVIHRLDNGMTVVTVPMPQVETVSLGVWVDVGARHERPEENGICHLIEHMAFKGTARRSAQDIAVEIDAVGGHLNAYTDREHTAFHAKMLKEDTALAVDVIADILQNSTFDPDELAREQQVILQEIAQAEDTPDDIVFDLFQEAAYPDQAMGRPILGTPETVRAATRATLRDYVAQCYAPERMVVAASGNIDPSAFTEMVTRSFALADGARPALPLEGNYVGGEARDERDLEQVNLVIGFPGVSYTDPDHYAASILATALGGGMSSRLFQEIREKRGLAYSVYAFATSFLDGGLLAVHAGTGEDELAELVPVLCDQTLAMATEVTEEEVIRARAQLKAGLLMSQESTNARCGQAARQLMIHGRLLSTAEAVREIEAVDAEAVRRVARRLYAAPVTIAAVGPLRHLEDYDKLAARLAL